MKKQTGARSVIGTFAAWLLPVVLGACGGAATPQPVVPTPPAASAVEATPVPRAIPADLWLLVPANAMAVVELDATRLRLWSEYPTLRRWLSQYGCVQDADLLALLDRVERAVGAVGTWEDRTQDGLLLMRGTFSAGDAATLAAKLGGAVTPAQRGRWSGFASDKALVVLLDETTLLVAYGAWRDDVLALASTGDGQRVRTAGFVERLTPLLAADGHVVLAMAAPSGAVASDILRDIGRWGGSAASISAGLAAEPNWGVRATIAADNAALSVFGVATGGTEQHAADLVDALSSAVWQAGLFMRLIGLPPILSTANLQHAAGTATLGLIASGPDMATLLARLEDMVRSSAAPCAPPPAIAVSRSP